MLKFIYTHLIVYQINIYNLVHEISYKWKLMT